jgi:hypothetical protein
MPYSSDKQRKWAHTETGIKALGGKDKVYEWDEATTKQGFKRLKKIIKKEK